MLQQAKQTVFSLSAHVVRDKLGLSVSRLSFSLPFPEPVAAPSYS